MFRVRAGKKFYAVEPRPNEIQIDIDGPRELAYFESQMIRWRLSGYARGWRVYKRRSASRGHWHITIRLPEPMNLPARVMYAALLGSDRIREMRNTIRILNRARMPVLFFETGRKSHRLTGIGLAIKRRGRGFQE